MYSSISRIRPERREYKDWDDLQPLQMLTQLIRNIPAKQIIQILKRQKVFMEVIMGASSNLLKDLAIKKKIQQDQIQRNQNATEQDKFNVLDLTLKGLMYHCGKHKIIDYKAFLKGKLHHTLDEHSHFGRLLVQLNPDQYKIGKKVKLAHLKYSRIIYKQYFPGRPFNYDSQQSEQAYDDQQQNEDPNLQKNEQSQKDSQSDDSFIENDEIVQYQDDFSSQREFDFQPDQDRPKKRLGGKKRIKENKETRQNKSSSQQSEIEVLSSDQEPNVSRLYYRKENKKKIVQIFDLEQDGITTKKKKKFDRF